MSATSIGSMMRIRLWTWRTVSALLAVVAVLMTGCSAPVENASLQSDGLVQRRFHLRTASAKQVTDILSGLDLGMVATVDEGKAVEVTGSPDDLQKAHIIVELVDRNEPYILATLAPISAARTMPSNTEIARFLGNVTVGTFASPPKAGEARGALVDLCRDHVVAVIPSSAHGRLMSLIRLGPDDPNRPQPLVPARDETGAMVHHAQDDRSKPRESRDSVTAGALHQGETPSRPRGRVVRPITGPPEPAPATLPAASHDASTTNVQAAVSSTDVGDSRLPQKDGSSLNDAVAGIGFERYEPVSLPNADEVLKLDLPEQLEMTQLLELVGEYLHLDYLYEPEKIKGTVTLRVHGKLQGQMKVRDLYCLLESVLKFKGFVMTCHKDNLVAIVPVAEALQVNPDLIDSANRKLQIGDMVVTSVFELRHIHASAASTLLQNMKLSLAVAPVEGAQSLIVTCYAHQIDRIERLLAVVDRPGLPRQFTFHQLRYTMAESLTRKVEALLRQMGNVAVEGGAPLSANRPSSAPLGTGSTSEAVYLDADERTNRILLIGYADQIALAERLIDSLDVAQQDLRVLKVYDLQYVDAEEVKKKLQELEIISPGAGPRPGAGTGKIAGAEIEGALAEEAVVVVVEATNSLVINATEEQHARVEAMLAYLDAEVRAESIPYEIYFLENQDPEGLAEVIEKIIHETVQDKEGKLQKILRDADDQIMIVPDKDTFSLIVYAARKNQEWISKLIKTLDRRRPQVLIDVTLVEIRKMDEFNYDLNLITSIPDLTDTGGQTGQFYADQNTTVVEKLLQSNRNRYIDFEVASGVGTGFYADRHINALLTAVQQKNYGRVLAKPKVLVNDNEKGSIKTADTTYVVTRSSIPVTSGSAGQQNTLIETETKYEPYDAGITLEITPHISEGQLLRLEITLSRSDFTSVADEKPPDQTSSDIATVVTVPDSSTIILGGMLKLNQSKATAKVPILGDLPLVGGIFRSVDKSDVQSMLYIFVRAEIIRPADTLAQGYEDLKRISDESRKAFEQHEQEFQNYQTWPGIKPKPLSPTQVLEAR